jgi:hypothetical protein
VEAVAVVATEIAPTVAARVEHIGGGREEISGVEAFGWMFRYRLFPIMFA